MRYRTERTRLLSLTEYNPDSQSDMAEYTGFFNQTSQEYMSHHYRAGKILPEVPPQNSGIGTCFLNSVYTSSG